MLNVERCAGAYVVHKMTKKCSALILIIIIAIVLRLPHLKQRPMHGDEAVQAYKFGQLLEENSYQYNPIEYHGPTLNYFTLIPAWLSGIDKFKDLNEFTLRIVPVFFSVLLVVLLLLLIDGLGVPAVIIAAVFTSISPAMVFYGRYYIHETLLVCFTFGAIACGYRYVRSKSIKWILLAAIFAGLMHATKETCIIAFGSILLAALLTINFKFQVSGFRFHLIIAVAIAVIISALFYSSFLTNPKAILDAFRAYSFYFHRASQNQLHIHPWYYYLKILIYSRVAGGPVWSEAIIIILAGAGFIVAIKAKNLIAVDIHLIRFIAFYTLIMTVIYSVIPYKTPWCLLGFLHGMILLAAVGLLSIIKLPATHFATCCKMGTLPGTIVQLLIGILLVAGIVHLGWQAYLANYKYFTDPRNPYVYAHPTTDVFAILKRVEEIGRVHEDGYNMHIQVICPDYDYWPLPWYLRSFSRVGYWDHVDENVASAPVIIASPEVESALMKKLYDQPPPGEKNLYVPLFDTYMELRPPVELRGYVRKDLWDRFQQHQTHTSR